MARARRKKLEDQQHAAVDSTLMERETPTIAGAVNEVLDRVTEPAREEPDVFDEAIAARQAAENPQPAVQAEAVTDGNGQQLPAAPRKWSLPDPHGHHGTLVSPEGHRVRELFGRQYHQQKIMFTAPEGENPKPDQKYIEMMHDMGWKWRASDKMWEKQLLTPDESAEVKQLRDEGKKDEANALKWKHTGAGWEECQRDYHHLVDTMRADAGMEPSEIITDNLKYLDRGR